MFGLVNKCKPTVKAGQSHECLVKVEWSLIQNPHRGTPEVETKGFDQEEIAAIAGN